LYFLARSMRNRRYWHSLAERLGFLPRSFTQTGPGAIWLHAVSVGEILSSSEFLKRLRTDFPHTRIFVSTTTLAGREVARQKLTNLTDGVFYAPVDYVWAVRRVLRTLKPSVLLVAETEIWPNLFRETRRTGAAVAILNGRISDRAFPRYRAFPWFFRAVLPAVNEIHAQTAVMRERFLALGATPATVRVAGNWKYDFESRPAPPESPVPAFLRRLHSVRVWIAASTVLADIDEDDAVLSAFRELTYRFPDLLLILVPRKPERFDIVARKLEEARIPFLRRSTLAETSTSRLPAVFLLDTVGELSGLFFAAEVVFMGGTLADRGGHNILEPAFFGKPIITGPHMENFQAISDQFRAAGACVTIGSSAELSGAVARLLDSPAAAAEIGRKALACAESQRGATGRALELARDLYRRHLPSYRVAQPWFPVLWLLSKIWSHSATRRPANPQRLAVPVISIGNLTMGGTGKTPCVLRLAALFKQSGRRPGILTRGYGRQSPEKQLILGPGANVPPDWTGDEAQLLLRSGVAPVGIGADRYLTGSSLQREFGVDVLLLDDGFQHRRLARSLDIVLIDALNPFGRRAVFPLGRLREPIAGIRRADLILITRSDLTDLGPAIEGEIRRWNSNAPVFYSRQQPSAWIDHRTGGRIPLGKVPFERALAFCGLGNPQSLRRTLEAMEVPLAEWVEFGDHHRYRPQEMRNLREQALACGADALVTTEKDAVNLCDASADLFAPLPLFRLQIELVIEREAEFLALLETAQFSKIHDRSE
jgi:tetraacyldisaccharide 4'-kinase